MSDDAVDEFLAGLLQALADFFEPIERAAAGPESLNAFLRQVGWTLDAPSAGTLTAIGTLADAVVELADQADELASGDDAAMSQAAGAATGAVVQIASGVAGLAQQQARAGALPGPEVPGEGAGPPRLRLPGPPQAAAVRDPAARRDPRRGVQAAGNRRPRLEVAYVERQLVLERVGDLVTDPGSLPAKVYGWGTPDFRATKLLRVFESTGAAFGARR